MDVQLDVRVAYRDVGPTACTLSELVYNGVFHLVAHKFGMFELLGEYYSVYSKSAAFLNIVAPVYFLHFVVYIVGRLCLEMLYRLEDADGGVKLKVGAVHQFFVTGEGYHTAAYLNIVGAQLGEFLCQNGFQTHECLGNHLKFHIVVALFSEYCLIVDR